MTPDKRPQDPHMDGPGLRFETMEHGGEYPMPQAIKLIDAEGRSCIYVPITQDGKGGSTARGLSLIRRTNDGPATRPRLSFDFHRAHDELVGQLSQLCLRFSVRHQVCVVTTCGGLTSEIDGAF